MATQNYTISTSADLAAAIAAIDQTGAQAAANTAYTFTFANSVTLDRQLDAINLDAGSSLTIVGNGYVLDGAGKYNGLFVYGGAVTVENLTISDAVATGGVGGNGLYGGGGGAGLGGGLFVSAGGDVTLQSVAFNDDSAVGGAGNEAGGVYSGGGGGLDGGAGGQGSGNYNDDPNNHYQDKGIIDGGGGGGVGLSATGGSGQYGAGASGIIPGAAAGQAGSGQTGVGNPGPNGAGGKSAGGGGAGSDVGTGGSGGAGGFGGGGGGGFGEHTFSDQGTRDAGGGSGGFGGGGGGVGGSGGFGGGGGGGYLSYSVGGGKGGAKPHTLTYDGTAGFGGGNGGGKATGSGGGGLGAGGDIFVQQGGTLTIDGGSLAAGTATGGTAAAGGSPGSGFGSGLFIQGNQSVTLNASPGQTLRLDGVIADEHGSIAGYTEAGALDFAGGGQIFIDPATPNTYTGGTTVTNGTTVVYGKDGALGSGPLAQEDASELIVQSTSFSVSTSVLDGPQDYPLLPYAQHGEVSLGSVPGYVFQDSFGGTELIPQTITVTDDLGLSAAITEIDAATKQMAADGMTGSFTIDLANSITLGRQLSAVNIAAGSSLTIDGGGATLNGNSTYQGFVVSAGTVAVDDITISRALAQGGAGSGGGGGGAGLGGGVFVGADAAVTLTNTTFAGVDEAAGGAGSSSTAGGPGGGLNGGPAGSVGFGDGGVGRPFVSGDANNGGNGGFGGGGGQGGPEGQPGTGGFGAGNGAPASDYGGGGGLGAGGDVFVQQGGSLTIQDSTLNLGAVAGGSGSTSASGSGDAFGSGLFIQGHDRVTLDALAGQMVAVAGVIADEHGSIASDPAEGSLLIDGPGDVVLSALNTFTGGTQLDDGTLTLNVTGAAGGGPITFGGAALLQFPEDHAPTTTPIQNFRVGDTIEIEGFTETSDGYSSPTLTLHGNHPEVMLDIPGLDLADLKITESGNNTFLTLTKPACYCAGTRIDTDRGAVAIEHLRIGDTVTTATGLQKPIRWIGRRSYSGRFIAVNGDSLPVCIRAGAIANNVPNRDLFVSPLHAMFLDGVLVAAIDLANGASIFQVKGAEKVEYFHIELAEHDIILAEGAPSESFVDDGSRMLFHNAREFAKLYPEAKIQPALYCAPRITAGYPLESIRHRLAARAGLRGEQQAEPLHGFLDNVSVDLVEGWAQNPLYPEAPVCLDIVVGGRLAIRTLANVYRGDLLNVGLGSGRHGFSVRLPVRLTSDERAGVEVRRSSDQASLPLSIACQRAA